MGKWAEHHFRSSSGDLRSKSAKNRWPNSNQTSETSHTICFSTEYHCRPWRFYTRYFDQGWWNLFWLTPKPEAIEVYLVPIYYICPWVILTICWLLDAVNTGTEKALKHVPLKGRIIITSHDDPTSLPEAWHLCYSINLIILSDTCAVVSAVGQFQNECVTLLWNKEIKLPVPKKYVKLPEKNNHNIKMNILNLTLIFIIDFCL